MSDAERIGPPGLSTEPGVIASVSAAAIPLRTARQRRDPRGRVALGRVSTLDALVQALTQQILEGSIPAGTHLTEIDRAPAPGATRQSLPPALADLVHLALLHREPHRGVWV